MSTRRSIQEGRRYLESKIREYAYNANIHIDDFSWRSLLNSGRSELTIISLDKQKQHLIDHNILEFETERYLDTYAKHTIVSGLHSWRGESLKCTALSI